MSQKGIFFKFFLRVRRKTPTFARYITHACRVKLGVMLVDIQNWKQINNNEI